MKLKLFKKFPQINRIITAVILPQVVFVLKTAVIGLIVVICLFSFHTVLFPENQEYIKLKVNSLHNPADPASLTALALYLTNHGLISEADKNFALAQIYYLSKEKQNSEQKILGEQTSPLSLYQQIRKEQQAKLEQLNYWQEIVKQKPLYRDAYLQIGLLTYCLGRFPESQAAFKKAIEVDPFYPYQNRFARFLN